MSRLMNMGAAADDFLDDVCLAEWGFMALSESKALRLAARIIPTVLWTLFCTFAYVYLFDIILPLVWHGGIGKYLSAGVLILFYASLLLILVGFIAALATCERRYEAFKQGSARYF